MQTASTSKIYLLTRRDGTPLFISPFHDPTSLLERETDDTYEGLYGSEPRVEAITKLRNELYRRIESDVRDWINERRFIPRFLISAGVFLVVYLFLSLVIRDPIPLIDELLLGLAGAVASYLAIGRRFEQSSAASNKRIALRAKVDAIVFHESPFLSELEGLLHRLEGGETGEDEENSVCAAALWERYRAETTELLIAIRPLLATKRYRSLSRQLHRGTLTPSTKTLVEAGELVPALLHITRLLQETST